MEERLVYTERVEGSSPSSCTIWRGAMVAQAAVNRKVVGSNPTARAQGVAQLGQSTWFGARESGVRILSP